ncbi:MAG: hypothetical protein LBK68_00005 [Candidatus Margulisbacteria bacterium]|nr:hypothetical protein [Candidatus Margulisiibacteriota bacterium]
MANANNYTDTTDTDFKGENYNIDIGKSLSAEGMRNALHTKENVTNKTDVIDSNNSSDIAQYPSVKAVYDSLNEKDSNAVHKTGTETITGVKTFGTVDAAAEPLLGVAKITDATNSGIKFATEAQVSAVRDAKQDKMTPAQQSALDSGITASKVSAYDSYFANLSFFPKGTILTFNKDAWDAENEIFRSIWKVCDGTNNTPNLIDKFLRGAEYPANKTGGADSQDIILQTKHMPKHNHSFQGNEETGSYNYVKKDVMGATGVFSLGGDSGSNYLIADNISGAVLNFSMTPSGTISETGGGSAVSGYGESFTVQTVPSYYTVIYIMKVV